MLSMKEVERKIIHLAFGLLISAAIYYDLINQFVMLIILVAGICISFIYKRFELPLMSWFIEKFERANAKENFPGKGAIHFFAGATLAMLLFDRDIALASVLILSVGDSVAPLIGQFGRIRNPFSRFKFIEGTASGIIAASIAASFVVIPQQAFIGSLFGMAVESMDVLYANDKIDDNVVIPLVAGTAITSMKILGI